MVEESSASRKLYCLGCWCKDETSAVGETGSTIRRDKNVMSCMWEVICVIWVEGCGM